MAEARTNSSDDQMVVVPKSLATECKDMLYKQLRYLQSISTTFASGVPDISRQVAKVKAEFNAIVAEVKEMDISSEKKNELRKLTSVFNDCIYTAKEFLQCCRDMANFCLSDGLVDSLVKELPQSVGKLWKFIEEFFKFFEICKEKLEEFKVQHSNTDYQAKLNDAEKKFAEIKLESKAEVASKVSMAVLSEVAKADIPSDSVGLIAGVHTAIKIFAEIYSSQQAKELYRVEQDIRKQARVQEIARSAEKEVSKFQGLIADVRDDVMRIWSHACTASVRASGLKSTFDQNTVELDPVDIASINTRLGGLCSSMKTIQHELGKTEDINVEVTISPLQATSDSDSPTVMALNLPTRQTIGTGVPSSSDQEGPVMQSIEVERGEEQSTMIMPPPPQPWH